MHKHTIEWEHLEQRQTPSAVPVMEISPPEMSMIGDTHADVMQVLHLVEHDHFEASEYRALAQLPPEALLEEFAASLHVSFDGDRMLHLEMDESIAEVDVSITVPDGGSIQANEHHSFHLSDGVTSVTITATAHLPEGYPADIEAIFPRTISFTVSTVRGEPTEESHAVSISGAHEEEKHEHEEHENEHEESEHEEEHEKHEEHEHEHEEHHGHHEHHEHHHAHHEHHVHAHEHKHEAHHSHGHGGHEHEEGEEELLVDPLAAPLTEPLDESLTNPLGGQELAKASAEIVFTSLVNEETELSGATETVWVSVPTQETQRTNNLLQEQDPITSVLPRHREEIARWLSGALPFIASTGMLLSVRENEEEDKKKRADFLA